MPTTVTRYDVSGNQISQAPYPSDGSSVSMSNDLPNYQNLAYREVWPYLEVCGDAFQGSTAWILNDEIVNADKAVRYLPKEPQEKSDQYAARLRRSRYKNAFKSAVKGFAGLLSDFELSDDAVIADWEQNCDRQGSSLTAFLCDADELVLRDGMCGVLVDYPQRPPIDNAEQEQALDLRPYLVLFERKDIPNWHYDSNGQLDRVTLKLTEIRVSGDFGEEEVTVYHVWFPGQKQIWEERKGSKEQQSSLVLVEEIAVSIDSVPFVPYSVTSLQPFNSMPPLMDLALSNLHHYKLYSDYVEILHKCNLPVPVRKGYMIPGTMDGSALPPVVIGPNTAIDVPTDGDFYFAEPSGSAIGATRQAIIDEEESMMQETLNFLGSTGDRTKYEVQLRSSQARASLSLLAEQKESNVQKIFKIWAEWINTETVGGIEVSRDLLQEKLEETMVRVLSDMQTLGQLPLDVMLRSIQKGRVIPKDVDVDAIAQQVSPQQDEALGL